MSVHLVNGGGSSIHAGDGSYVDMHAIIRRPQLVKVGNCTNVDHGVYCTTAMELGDYVHIAPYCTIIGGEKGMFRMGHFSTLGAGSRIICASEDHTAGNGLVGPTIPEEFHERTFYAPVQFEPLAVVTTNCVILPGVTIGMGCVIGACALVRESTEPWGVYVGIPARKVKERPRERVLEAARRLGYEF